MPLLHMAEAADHLRDRRDFDGKTVIAWVEARKHVVNRLLILANQRALLLAFGGISERIERRAAQELEFGQQREGAHHPRPIDSLAQMACDGVARGKKRRCQMELDLPPLESLLEFLAELPIRVKARYFILDRKSVV